jgi:hypothetical protein
MYRFSGLLFLGLILGCSDGDLQIETIDFDSAPIQYCGTAPTTDTNILFKISNDEALILNLQDGLLVNEASDGTVSSTVPGQSNVTYRIFSDNVTKSYFCDDIPPADPTVMEEIAAVAGEVLVTTVQSATDTTAYVHTIELSGISLVNDQGERITDLRINNFGTVTTKN